MAGEVEVEEEAPREYPAETYRRHGVLEEQQQPERLQHLHDRPQP